MSSDAIRLLEIQLEVHKRSLHEKAQKIDELEARNIDLEAQVSLLREVVAKQQPQSKDELEPPAHPNPKQKKRRESDRSSEPESGSRESKRCRSNPQEVVQPRSSSNRHHAVDAGRHDGPADVSGVDGVNNGASGSPVRQPHQTPRNFPQPPGSAPQPAGPSALGSLHGETFGSSSPDRHRVNSFQHSHLVEDPGAESDSTYQPEDEDDALPAQASLAARLSTVEPFEHGIVAEEFLLSTADRQTLDRLLSCNSGMRQDEFNKTFLVVS
ncbi:hypothetical protein V8D89_006544 [Ganoderma adspersum]